MSDEILLSESNLEKVWMNEGWEVRIERTELGDEWAERKKPNDPAPTERYVWAWVGLAAAVSTAIGVAWGVWLG